MSVRGDRSRQRIMEAARVLFASRGFAAVSMQDICQAAGLSRGGLYRHYGSTADVFAALIRQEQAQAFAALEEAKAQRIPPDAILLGFIRCRMASLLNPQTSIDNATGEFAAVSAQGRELLRKRAASSVDTVAQMLAHGVEAGAFACQDCQGTALHIMCTLEGMGKHNGLFPLSHEEVERQLRLIYNLIKK